MKIKPLFRVAPKTATDEQVAEANELQKRKGVHIFPPAEEIRHKASWVRTIMPERAVAWALHPDERIAIELAGNSTLRHTHWPHHYMLHQVLSWRAVRDARAEGVVWTPLLDAVATREWRDEDIQTGTLSGFKPRFNDKSKKAQRYTKAKDPFLKLLGPNEQITGKLAYFSEIQPRLLQASLGERMEVKHFRAESFILLVAALTSMEEWDATVAQKWAGIRGAVGAQILRNPDLDEDIKKGVYWHVATQIEKTNRIDYMVGDLMVSNRQWVKEPLWSLAIGEIKRWRGGSDRARSLWDWISDCLDAVSDAQWEQLRECIPIVAGWDEPHMMRDILKDKRLNRADVEAMLSQNRGADIRAIIASSPAANIKGIAEKLSQSKRGKVGRNLASNVQPETYGRIFKRMAENHPNAALNSLEERQDDVAQYVDRKAMVPLLTNEDKEKRLKAVKLIVKVGPQVKTESS